MTAEVAVINKSAVAIAADSAVTTGLVDSSGRWRDKIFNTANKVFALSKYSPVGIMVYNTMELGGVPWETLIKDYRRHLAKQKFDYLEEYADDFFDFLSGNETLFDEDHIKKVLLLILVRFFVGISSNINSNSTAKEVFEQQIEELEKLNFADSFDENFTRLPNDYNSVIDGAVESVFQPSIIKNLKTKYRRLATLAITKEQQLSGYSGVVITGFGEKEIFPKLIEYKTDLVILDKIRKSKLQEFVPSHFNSGKVMSFAQEDITRTILEGINPSYANEIYESAIGFFAMLPEKIINGIDELSDDQKTYYRNEALNASAESLKEFFKGMNEERKNKHTFQIEKAIAMVPFSELAEIAEVFIRLTQVRRRLSLIAKQLEGLLMLQSYQRLMGLFGSKGSFISTKS